MNTSTFKFFNVKRGFYWILAVLAFSFIAEGLFYILIAFLGVFSYVFIWNSNKETGLDCGLDMYFDAKHDILSSLVTVAIFTWMISSSFMNIDLLIQSYTMDYQYYGVFIAIVSFIAIKFGAKKAHTKKTANDYSNLKQERMYDDILITPDDAFKRVIRVGTAKKIKNMIKRKNPITERAIKDFFIASDIELPINFDNRKDCLVFESNDLRFNQTFYEDFIEKYPTASFDDKEERWEIPSDEYCMDNSKTNKSIDMRDLDLEVVNNERELLPHIKKEIADIVSRKNEIMYPYSLTVIKEDDTDRTIAFLNSAIKEAKEDNKLIRYVYQMCIRDLKRRVNKRFDFIEALKKYDYVLEYAIIDLFIYTNSFLNRPMGNIVCYKSESDYSKHLFGALNSQPCSSTTIGRNGIAYYVGYHKFSEFKESNENNI